MKKPRQTSYLYHCERCQRNSTRGSNAKRCDLWSFWGRHCGGPLRRLKTVKGPIPTKLKATGVSQ